MFAAHPLPATPGRERPSQAGPRQPRPRDPLDAHPRGDPRGHRRPDDRPHLQGTTRPPTDAMQVTVIGKQWWWEFQYPASNGQQPGRHRRRAAHPDRHERVPQPHGLRPSLPYGVNNGPGCNVIHSFWVPELAGKIDVVPGQTNHMTLRADTPGTFLGQCSQYCGLSHANMRFRVIVQSPSDFDAWLASQRQRPGVSLADVRRGRHPVLHDVPVLELPHHVQLVEPQHLRPEPHPPGRAGPRSPAATSRSTTAQPDPAGS